MSLKVGVSPKKLQKNALLICLNIQTGAAEIEYCWFCRKIVKYIKKQKTIQTCDLVIPFNLHQATSSSKFYYFAQRKKGNIGSFQ